MKMSSEQLGRLEKLAARRAELSRDLLMREQEQLRQIDHHRSELRSINQQYQKNTTDKASIAPQLLAQSRLFVEQLTLKLEQLSQQREQRLEVLKTRRQELQKRAAQHAAIELINKQRIEEKKYTTQRRDQQQLDEVASVQFYQRHRLNKEQGYD